ncbi:hypothetical protein V2J66_06980 [Pseudomonas alliivorans]|nr:hypothetical protein [Pseudomonas alliivorans]MEE5124963.1 hypothetical protein [Pseudomonas alliivorans]MEE5131290.1 hypothetical protein [Pseudomonas alliivorans]MEE5163175.1 hypothetical protein [Pseudomonas alliivorans]
MEVDVRLLKALASLAQINPELFQKSCAKQADLLLKRANSALALQEDKDQLRTLARPLAV